MKMSDFAEFSKKDLERLFEEIEKHRLPGPPNAEDLLDGLGPFDEEISEHPIGLPRLHKGRSNV